MLSSLTSTIEQLLGRLIQPGQPTTPSDNGRPADGPAARLPGAPGTVLANPQSAFPASMVPGAPAAAMTAQAMAAPTSALAAGTAAAQPPLALAAQMPLASGIQQPVPTQAQAQAFAARAEAAPLAFTGQQAPGTPAAQAQLAPQALPLPARADGALPAAPSAAGSTTSAATAGQAAGNSAIGNPAATAAGTPAATATANAAGTTQAATVLAMIQSVPASQSPGDTRGGTQLGVDRAQARAEGVAHGYTLDGLQQRRGRMTQGLGLVLSVLGLRRQEAARDRQLAEQTRMAERAFQWLYWMLAIVAYACLAGSILILLPVFDPSSMPMTRSPEVLVGGLATLGLVAAFVAWILARRMR